MLKRGSLQPLTTQSLKERCLTYVMRLEIEFHMFKRHWKKPPLSTTKLTPRTLKTYSKERTVFTFQGTNWPNHALSMENTTTLPTPSSTTFSSKETSNNMLLRRHTRTEREALRNQAKPKKPKEKPSAATKSAAAQAKPSAATKSTADKLKSSAAKSTAADKPQSSAATTSATDKPKSSAAKSAADKANPSAAKATSATDRAKRTGKPSPQQWRAKIPASIPPRIIIGSVECTHAKSDIPRTLFFKDTSSWIPPTN
ncbi:hypothetical protein L1987_15459 [Smallanthus sonchifolius]|uniref:Uncharacterized protein n=1 Tax=Smallanthus sonchifolius TaxID=185202 RepID=A0ACB9J6M9_9ASTR|nr:hypothetical protein L1987_15459 [Smallanthus sonchifolius]